MYSKAPRLNPTTDSLSPASVQTLRDRKLQQCVEQLARMGFPYKRNESRLMGADAEATMQLIMGGMHSALVGRTVRTWCASVCVKVACVGKVGQGQGRIELPDKADQARLSHPQLTLPACKHDHFFLKIVRLVRLLRVAHYLMSTRHCKSVAQLTG